MKSKHKKLPIGSLLAWKGDQAEITLYILTEEKEGDYEYDYTLYGVEDGIFYTEPKIRILECIRDGHITVAHVGETDEEY